MKSIALFAVAMLTLPVAAVAQPVRGYAATPVTAPSDANIITRSTLWKCNGGTCVASKASGSHLTMCQLVAQQVGTLSGFTANGVAFEASQLEKCNARAR